MPCKVLHVSLVLRNVCVVKFALGNVKSVCVDCCLSGCTEILPYGCSRCVDDGKCGVSNGVKFSFSVNAQNAHTLGEASLTDWI